MGIHNIQILIESDNNTMRLQQAALEEALIIQHHHGKHPWGFMRRDCPLCQK